MKIKKLILEDFRCFYGKVEIPLEDFTVFIGKNDQGKSTILEAIDIFINEGKGAVKIDEDDLNQQAKREGKEFFRIGIVFKNLPKEIIIDTTSRTNLKEEYLLNEEDLLEIWKTFKKSKLQEKETSIRCVHPINDDFIKDLMRKKITDLQSFIKEKNIKSDKVDQRNKADLRRVIRNYYIERDRELKMGLIEIKIEEEGIKEIWPKLQNYLPVYALFHSDRKNIDQDEEIQDPLKITIEQIFKREDIKQKLNDIAEEIDKEIRIIAETTVKKFQELTRQSLEINIIPNIPEVSSLKWRDVYKGIGFKTNDDIPLNKRGSGLRRIVLVSFFLAEVAKKKSNSNENHVIYAIEEPESFLHPDLQSKLINALKELSEQEFYQIFLTTHSPTLIRLIDTKSIKYVERFENMTYVKNWSEDIAYNVIKNMGFLPNIGKVIICLEGRTDETFLCTINQNISELREIIDLKDKLDKGIIAIYPMRGSNCEDWINRYILKNTSTIEFHLYDRDIKSDYEKYINEINLRKDGSKGFITKKREIENYIPKEIIEEVFGINLNEIDENRWDELDIPNIVSKKTGMSEISVKQKLTGECSKKLTKQHLEKLNAWEEIKGWFEELKNITEKVIKTT